jgi:hypothetical protein
MYELGRTLHKTLGEILAMPVAEFAGWLAFFRLTNRK